MRPTGVPNNRINAAGGANPPKRPKTNTDYDKEKNLERFLTECKTSCAQDDVIRGEHDVLCEGAGMLRCPRCEVICSSGKDANSHWKDGENVIGYTCEKCEKKFERLT